MKRIPFNLLVVEDDAAMRELLVETLAEEGYQVDAVANGLEGLGRARSRQFDLVVTDLRMPGMDGLDLVREVRALSPAPAVITITAFGSIETAIKAVKLGAIDYITKPLQVEELLHAIRRVFRDRELEHELVRLRHEVSDKYHLSNIIGHSSAMQGVFELVRRVADSSVSVLISGESGTGKELVARALHYNGPRVSRPFVPVNCAAIPTDLLESELFGYKQGAFTGAVRDRAGLLLEGDQGTVFLDEIGELPLSLQVKLLRVLQEREIKPLGSTQRIPLDIRVVSATNQDLERMMADGSFRADLYYRLNVVQIDIPPLRQRTEDVLPIAQDKLEEASKRAGKTIASFSQDAAKALLSYSWPGNVRELENVVERAVALSHGSTVEVDDLPAGLLKRPPRDLLKTASSKQLTLAELEREYILQVLDEEGGNKTHAAQRLGLDRTTLYRKLDDYRKTSMEPNA